MSRSGARRKRQRVELDLDENCTYLAPNSVDAQVPIEEAAISNNDRP